jgi:hypothetical protein
MEDPRETAVVVLLAAMERALAAWEVATFGVLLQANDFLRSSRRIRFASWNGDVSIGPAARRGVLLALDRGLAQQEGTRVRLSEAGFSYLRERHLLPTPAAKSAANQLSALPRGQLIQQARAAAGI